MHSIPSLWIPSKTNTRGPVSTYSYAGSDLNLIQAADTRLKTGIHDARERLLRGMNQQVTTGLHAVSSQGSLPVGRNVIIERKDIQIQQQQQSNIQRWGMMHR